MKNYTITVNGVAYDVVVEEKTSTQSVNVQSVPTAPAVQTTKIESKPTEPTQTIVAGSILVTAGAAGKVFKVESTTGATVKKGDPIVILEAMKMEIPIVASCDGTVASINVQVGDMVESGATLATMNA